MNPLLVLVPTIQEQIQRAIARNEADKLEGLLISNHSLCPPNHWWTNLELSQTWLTYAVKKGFEDCVAVLMHYGADPFFRCMGNRQRNAIDMAWYHHEQEYLTQFLLSLLCVERVIKPPNKQKTPDCLNYIGEDVNAPLKPWIYYQGEGPYAGCENTTCLHYAVDWQLPYCVDWLLTRRGADVNIKDTKGHTPLYCLMKKFDVYFELASEHGDRKRLNVWQGIAYTLIQHGADTSSDESANTAFPNARRFMLWNGMIA